MPKSQLRTIQNHGVQYTALMFVCPGCAMDGSSGIHMLPVNTTLANTSWGWDGNLETPTLTGSILSRAGGAVCHSFLRAGVFDFLTDCTHELAGQQVPMPELPEWAVR